MAMSEPETGLKQKHRDDSHDSDGVEQRLRAIETQQERQEKRIQELEQENEELRQEVADKDEDIEFLQNQLFTLEGHIFGDFAPEVVLDDDLESSSLADYLVSLDVDSVEELHQRIVDEENQRGKEDALLTRKLNHLADEVEVDLAESELSGEDKITRLLRNGPEDIADRVYTVHYRVRDLLSHAGDIGSATTDQFGKRITFHSPVVQDELKKIRDENVTSGQVRRVFEKVEDLAEDSPRRCHTDFSGDTNKLVIYLSEEGS